MKNSEVEKYVVGEKFGRKIDEGCLFEIYDNLCSMTLCLDKPQIQEVNAVERGVMRTVLSYVDGIIFLCVLFDDCLYYEAPFNMALYKQFQLKSPGKNGYIMPIFLVDKESNILCAMRAIGFNNEFSKTLYMYSKIQWDNPIRDYNRRLDFVRSRYQPKEIIRAAVAVNVFGGTK